MLGYGRSLVVVCGVTLALGASGCEVAACKNDAGKSAICLKSEKRYEGDAIEPEALPYTPGTSVSVHGIYGDIRVVEGEAGEVRVKLEPFDYRAYDAEDAARRELSNNFDHLFAELEAGISVQTGRHDSTNGLGADITLYLPPEFDGKLTLVNHSDGPVNPGDVAAEFVGAAFSVDVTTTSLGDCTVRGTPSVLTTRAHCDGDIVITGVSNGGTIAATGLDGNVRLELAAIDESGGASIDTEDGDITVKFPPDASFTVSALANEDGTVSATPLEQACEFDLAAENSKSYTCGDAAGEGPHFGINAGTNGVGPSNITLEF